MIGQMKKIDFGPHLGSKISGGILGSIKSIFDPKWGPILMYGYCNYNSKTIYVSLLLCIRSVHVSWFELDMFIVLIITI